MRVKFPYGGPVYGSEEIGAMHASIASGRFWGGEFTHKLEEELVRYLGVSRVVVVNSGSSALLLAGEAISTLIPKNSRVVTQALTFPTNINTSIQVGRRPVLIDVELDTLNVNAQHALEIVRKSGSETLTLTHTIGNTTQLDELGDGLKEIGIPWIEDMCDCLGSSYKGRKIGTWGSVACSSLHPAHQISAGLGGFSATSDEKLGEVMHSLRDWGRASGFGVGERFRDGVDMQYYYTRRGYNLQLPEVCSAMGLVQLRKLDEFNLQRRRNFQRELEWAMNHLSILIPPRQSSEDISWFGFPLIFREASLRERGLTRFDVMRRLELEGVETRSIYGGCVNELPAYSDIEFDMRWSGSLGNSKYLSRNGMWVSAWHGLSDGDIEDMLSIIDVQLKGIGLL